MNLEKVYVQLGILFSLMLFGYILGKIKVIATEGVEAFSKFIVKVALPAMIISGMMIPLSAEKVRMTYYMLLLSVPAYTLAYIIAILFSKSLIKDISQRGVYQFGLVFSNVGFMGYPVLQAMFGDEAIFFAAIYNITFNILLYTLGIKLMKTGNNEGRTIDWKVFINPGVGASVIGLILFATGLRFPSFITGAVHSIGSLCTPLSMLTIGAMLSTLPFGSMFSNMKVYQLAFSRLILLPILTLVLFKYIFRIQDMWLIGVPVVVAGMPVASNAAMMAREYNNNADLASQIILISTLFSAITIPIIMYLI